MKRISIKFTVRQLELIQFACDLSQDGRRIKDRDGLDAISRKIEKLGIYWKGIN